MRVIGEWHDCYEPSPAPHLPASFNPLHLTALGPEIYHMTPQAVTPSHGGATVNPLKPMLQLRLQAVGWSETAGNAQPSCKLSCMLRTVTESRMYILGKCIVILMCTCYAILAQLIL